MKQITKRHSKWDRAIQEARAQLAEIKIRSARLKAAIKIFEENKNRGVGASRVSGK